MKELRNIAIGILCCFGIACAAQTTTTYNLTVPTACGVYSPGYSSCDPQVVTPSGNTPLHYAPRWGTQLGYLYFAPSSGFLDDLGYATVDSATTTLISSSDNGKKPNTQGYIKWTLYNESTTFHDQDGALFSGSSAIQYTTTLQCCSSGRGPSAHTTWVITAGTVTITTP